MLVESIVAFFLILLASSVLYVIVRRASPKPIQNANERSTYACGEKVAFQGHPNPARLLLPEDWPKNLYPLRKDANLEEVITKLNSGLNNTQPEIEKQQPPEDTGLVNIVVGTQHPALLEPEKF